MIPRLSSIWSSSAKRFCALSLDFVRPAARIVTIVSFSSLALSGCVVMSQSPISMVQSCLSDRLDIVENVDWSKVNVTEARFVDNTFRPMVMYFEKDRPYILRVTNLDRDNHSLWAPDLLKQGVALESIQIGDKTPAKGCVSGVRIPERTTVTFRFVPVWEGRYEMSDSGFPVFPAQLNDGVFHIIQPRVGLAAR
ncbi:MAG: hypothetical protein OQK24_00760 [Magnetovibrio sp.]|nr:hypothetical protein [Magnetovibrio sp.]